MADSNSKSLEDTRRVVEVIMAEERKKSVIAREKADLLLVHIDECKPILHKLNYPIEKSFDGTNNESRIFFKEKGIKIGLSFTRTLWLVDDGSLMEKRPTTIETGGYTSTSKTVTNLAETIATYDIDDCIDRLYAALSEHAQDLIKENDTSTRQIAAVREKHPLQN